MNVVIKCPRCLGEFRPYSTCTVCGGDGFIKGALWTEADQKRRIDAKQAHDAENARREAARKDREVRRNPHTHWNNEPLPDGWVTRNSMRLGRLPTRGNVRLVRVGARYRVEVKDTTNKLLLGTGLLVLKDNVDAGSLAMWWWMITSGLIVANFSSPHSFRFTDGTELGACSAERANASKLDAVEVEIDRGLWTDIDLNFRLSPTVLAMLKVAFDAWEAGEVHVVLVPFPVISSMKAAPQLLGFDPEDGAAHPFRTIRTADRVTKVNFADRFCM